MGKALIIKGADFSAVAAANIVIGGDIELTTDNYTDVGSGYFYNTGLSSSPTAKTYFYPIRQGSYLKCPGNNAIRQDVGITTSAIVEQDIFGDAGCVTRSGASFPGDIVIQAPYDGYVGLAAINSSGNDIFPIGSIITKTKPVTRIAGLDNYCYGDNRYLNAQGGWGNDTAPAEHYACLFYNVHPGEVVKVTATNGNQSVAFLKGLADITHTAPVFTQGTGRYSVAQGTTESFTVEKEAMLYLYAAGGASLQTVEITGV